MPDTPDSGRQYETTDEGDPQREQEFNIPEEDTPLERRGDAEPPQPASPGVS